MTVMHRVIPWLALVLLAATQAGARTAERPDLLLVSIDTLRADRLGCLGYDKPTSPELDALARRGLLFPAALSPVPLTLPAHATLLTGLQPWEHGVRDNSNFSLPSGVPSVAERLAAAGYDTAAFVSAYVLASPFGLARGFGRYDELPLDALKSGPITVPERRAGETVAAAGEWLARPRLKPLFAWVHLYDPHAPYAPPAPYDTRFKDPYDGEVAYTDAQLGLLLGRLPHPERTWLVVVSDHGEGLGEHGEATHGSFLYPATMRVLCLLVPPEGSGPTGVRPHPAGLADVAPTLLALAGAAPLKTGGRDLLSGDAAPRPAAAMETLYPWFHHGLSPMRGLADGRWWYVFAPREELYDRDADPGLARNLAGERPEEARRFRGILARVFAGEAAVKPSAAPAGPSDDALLSLGYLTGGRSGVPVMGRWRDLPDPKDRLDYLAEWERGLNLLVRGKGAQARQALESLLRKHPGDGELLKILGDLSRREKDFPAALDRYRAALAAAPALQEVRIKLIQVLMRLGRMEEARPELDRYREAIPGDPMGSYYLGMVDAQAGHHAEALRAYDDARRTGYTGPELDWRRALSHLALGETDRARTILRGIVQDHPGYAPAWYSLGTCAVEAGAPAEAKARFETAVRLEPGLLPAVLDLARVKRTLGDPAAESLALVRTVTALDGRNCEALELEGDLRLAVGDAAGARAAYGKALGSCASAEARARVRLKQGNLP